MTVQAVDPSTRTTASPGAETFPFGFKIRRASDLLVRVDGATKALGVDYSVAGVAAPTGSVTFFAPMVGGELVQMDRNMPYDRTTDYQNLGDLLSGTLNNDQDDPVLMIQQIDKQLGYAARFPDSLAPADFSALLPAPEDGSLLGWNSGMPWSLRNVRAADLVTVAGFADWKLDPFTATPGQATKVLTSSPGTLSNIAVTVDGLALTPGVDFTLNGTTVGFTPPLMGGEEVVVRYGQVLPSGLQSADSIVYTGPFVGGGTRSGQSKFSDFLNALDADGVVGNGVNDDTIGIQKALDYLETRGGGTLYFGPGTFIVSMANAGHPNACVRIPANVTIQGAGMFATTFTRPASERGTNGVLFVNKYYDTITNYGAAGHITIRDCGFTDGATTPNRALGDLVGFGNGDGLLVERCYFGNHDQHGVDICKSSTWDVTRCVFYNDVAQGASAAVQVDAGLIDGIAGPTLPSYNGKIRNNWFLRSRSNNIVHFHSANQASNVEVAYNYIDGTMCPNGSNAIGGDTDCTYDGVDIHHNYIVMANVTNRCINFPTLEDLGSGVVKGLRIYENILRGSFRIGIFAGDDSAVLTTYTGALNSIEIYDNDIEMNTGTGTLDAIARAVAPSLFKHSRVEGNVIRWIGGGVAQAQQVRLIADIGCQYSTIRGNRIERDTPDGAGQSYGIYIDFQKAYSNNLPTQKIVEANSFDGNGFDYLIFFADHGSMNTYLGLNGSRISRNTWSTGLTVLSAHIKEVAPLSDGTNGLQWADFSAQASVVATDKHMMAIASGTTYNNIPLPGLKQGKDSNQRVGKCTVELHYSPLSAAQFGTDCETITTVWTSATTCAGTVVKDIDPVTGTFDLVTGVSGVSMVINDTNWQPVIRTSGFLRILVGI